MVGEVWSGRAGRLSISSQYLQLGRRIELTYARLRVEKSFTLRSDQHGLERPSTVLQRVLSTESTTWKMQGPQPVGVRPTLLDPTHLIKINGSLI